MPILGSFSGGQSFGRSAKTGGINTSYFTTNGFNLISGSSGAYDAHYEKVYSTPGSYTFPHPTEQDTEAYILVVGGGGGGGAYHAGGGGAGGVVYGKVTLTKNASTTVVVGARGRGGIRDGNPNNDGEQGADSSFGGYVAKGGGYGRWRCTSIDGGCGGGGGHHAGSFCGQGERMSVSTQSTYAGFNTFPANGSASGGHGTNNHGAGGGGGAGRAGDLSISAGRNGQGGAGIQLMGRSLAGGGAGGSYSGQNNFVMPGGSGGGGNGAPESTAAQSASSHGSGGGGGGHSTNGHGGSGSDGIVIIRMHTRPASGTIVPESYFSSNSFSLISGAAGTADATYRRNFTTVGNFTFTAPPVSCTGRVILVGGGGGSASAHAGGGGGGGVVIGNYTFTPNQSISGSVGAGGSASGTSYGGPGVNGGDSTFGIWTAKGGGGGDGTNSGSGGTGGGSGGGGGPSSGAAGSGHTAGGSSTQSGISNPGATYNLGHAGGFGNNVYGSHGSGGGGGAGGIGHYSNATGSGSTHSKGNGDGGRGYYSPFLNTHWGGGGGGGGHNGNAWNGGGVGGAGGGGNGGPEGTYGVNGTDGLGGGAGGTGHSLGQGTAGGSGVCTILIRADGVASRIPE